MTYESALKFLSYGSIRLTPRQCLNDPFEILTPSNIKKKYSNRIDPNKFQNYLDLSGVVSLTETKDNLLMWSHYAKEHTGVVIEFQINELEPYSLFNMSPYFTEGRLFSKVHYRKTRHYDDTDDLFSAENMVMHYFFSKSDEWIYEKEFRYVLPFHVATHITYSHNKLPANIASKLPTNILSSDNSIAVSHDGEYTTIFTDMIAPQFLSELWINSKEYDIVFTILVNHSNIKKIYIGNNCDTHTIKKHISDKVNICMADWPYLNFYDSFSEEFVNVFKSTIHPDRYELIFKKVTNRR